MTGTSNGPTNPDFALTRYTSAGLLDTSFGTGGKVFTDVSRGDYSQKSLLWNGTKLVVFGGSDSAPFGVSFARYVLN